MIHAILLAQLAIACSPQAEPSKSLLLIVLDDVGAEHLEYTPQGQEAGQPAATPTLSALADEGILYTNLWTCPNCSPTRAALLTGRYGHRTGIGTAIQYGETAELALTEATIADRLSARGYSTSLTGKWHLGEVDPEQPCAMGFQSWSGTQSNLMGGANYWYWSRYDDSSEGAAAWSLETAYAPTATTDAALAWIGAQEGPWFALVSYNSAHSPYHDPPGMGPFTTQQEQYRAMVEYLDGEIGRLLAGVDLQETTVMILSDNGAPPNMALWPNTAAHSKGTAYRGGIETTMVVAGYAVRRAIAGKKNTPGQVLSGNAHVVDIYKTALRLMPGTDPGGWPATDSEALYTITGKWVDANRAWNFTERAEPLGVAPGGPYDFLSRAVEEAGFKLIERETGARELYDTATDPDELWDLLSDGTSVEEQAIVDGLDQILGGLGL